MLLTFYIQYYEYKPTAVLQINIELRMNEFNSNTNILNVFLWLSSKLKTVYEGEQKKGFLTDNSLNAEQRGDI